MGGFRKVGFGDLIESDDGYAVDLIVHYPAITIRYTEGSRTMDVYSEAQAKRATLTLDRSSMAGWEPPNALELVDDATRQTVLDRIVAALNFAGYVIDPIEGFPKVRNHAEGRRQDEERLARARLRWREDDELRRRWREDGDRLEDHRRLDTPR